MAGTPVSVANRAANRDELAARAAGAGKQFPFRMLCLCSEIALWKGAAFLLTVARYPVKSLAKALKLLDALGSSDMGTSITELSKELKMGKSTVHRLLATLREFDLVWLDPDTSSYALGARILRWSDLLVRQNLLIRHGVPILRELVQSCHETASLAVLDGAEIMFVARYESSQRLRMSDVVGGRCPAHCTALGKALLATLSEREFDALYHGKGSLKAMTANSITSKERLREHLRKVKQEGVAYDFEENVSGGVCLGTPVRNYTGKPVAAMSVSMPTQRLLGDVLITLKETLVSAAAKLSAELAYTGNDARGGPAREANHSEVRKPALV
jgi:DNA-binding IclR family transcriptional regulator